ncbi:MAG: hypothetical protein L6V95_10235 [Candidatus Melainabacteria bacterium]|nr:MAG: hypothetical protein L6V95_10235 [Candidatus Melainabacteria bacterium]
MTTFEFSFTISSKGFGEVIDITDKIESYLLSRTSNNGIIYIYNNSNDVAIKNIEIKKFKQKMTDENFQKLLLSGNNNMLILPIIDKKLYIDEMARILFVDFEKSANIRKIIVMCVS